MRFRRFRPFLRRACDAGAGLLVVLALVTFPRPGGAIEEPDYQVVRALADGEVRQYAAHTVAEVVVAGPADDAGRQAFPILAEYIFGKNEGERKLAMTAPVTQTAVPTRVPQTAPVTRTAGSDGFRVQFMLPRGVTLTSAPAPLDARVRIRDVMPFRVAVIRYTGLWSASNDGEHLARLEGALRSAGLEWSGPPTYARYNAPFTPWFMRRNEIWLGVSGPT